jgi:REP element-mobilizing transposase RayT
MPLLTKDLWREKLARCIETSCREAGIELVGFVFMPEHVHLLVYPTILNPSISRYLARINQPFSKQIKEILAEQGSRLLSRLTVRERPGKECFHFWQAGPGFLSEFVFPRSHIILFGLPSPQPGQPRALSTCRGLEMVVGTILSQRPSPTTISKFADDSWFNGRGYLLKKRIRHWQSQWHTIAYTISLVPPSRT